MAWWQTLNRDQRLLVANSFLTGFGVSLFLYLQPLYIARLGATPEQIGLTLSLSGLIVTALYIPLGLWADRRGRKPMIVAGWVLSGAACIGMAVAPDWRWFIPAFTLYLLSNFAVPAYQGYVVATSTPRTVNRIFATLALAGSVGSIAAPAVGGWIGETIDLRVVYLTSAAIFLLDAAFVLGRIMPQTATQSPAQQAPALSVLRQRPFLIEIGFIFLLFVAIDIGQVLAPKFLQEVRGLTVSEIGLLGSVGTLGIAVLTYTQGRLPAERRRTLALSQGVGLAALLLWLFAPLPALIGLAYFIHGGNRLIRPVTASRLAATLEPANMSFGFGFYQTAQQLGLTLSPFLAGLLYAENATGPLWAGVLGLAATLALTTFLPKKEGL